MEIIHINSEKMTDFFTEYETIDRVCRQLECTEKELQIKKTKLRKWYTEQEHLPQDAVSDRLLEKFLLGSKGDLTRATERLDSLFTIRNLLPVLFADRDPLSPGIQQSNQCLSLAMLPGLTEDGARVLICRLRTTDASIYNQVEFIKRVYNLLDISFKIDPLNHRLIMIGDNENCTPRHLMVSPNRIREAAFCLTKVYPFRIQDIIFINSSPILAVLVDKIVKPLLGNKLGKRISVCSKDYTQLYEKVPKSMLPNEYGGDAPSLKELDEKWQNFAAEHRDWLMTWGTLTSDESKRDGKCPITGPGCSVM